jgi:phosphoenolpyruvate-protein kinase (PTS system EI component)
MGSGRATCCDSTPLRFHPLRDSPKRYVGQVHGSVAREISALVAAVDVRDRKAVAAALLALDPAELAELFHRRLADDPVAAPLCLGLPASPGAASGRIALSVDAALTFVDEGDPVILVRRETSPDDVLGIQASLGLLTARGGLGSHAAVVARGWGIPAVVGASDVLVDEAGVAIGSIRFDEGDLITIDGSTGAVHAGRLTTTASQAPPELDVLLSWADAVARGQVAVRANADTAGDAAIGRKMGAQGIGLCRTEHMFLAADRLALMRRFILSDDAGTEAEALAALEQVQIADFESVLAEMDDLPVTVRLLDPPLHEFLPDFTDLVAAEARGALDDDGRHELAAVRRLHEVNPMLGTRGVRLGIVRRGVYEMQIRALCRAVLALIERGLRPRVEVMIPLVVDRDELRIARSWVAAVLDEARHPELASDVVTVGAMIETPRAALTAGALAEHADFFSFGTNDLTQLTYAFSRDDVESRLLPAYRALGILPANPFSVLDPEGVGRLVGLACEEARQVRPEIPLGACGEHAGDPASADLLVRMGISSVSCSPFRVPLARLAVAQALLRCGRVDAADVAFDAAGEVPRAAPPVADSAAGVQAVEPDRPVDDDEPLDVDEALILHVARVRGAVTSHGWIGSLGAPPGELLDALVERGELRYIEARDLHLLTPSGRARHESLHRSSLDSLASSLSSGYEPFLELNQQVKELCTRWQMRDGVLNDHSDPEYDRGCVAELQHVAASADDVVRSLAEVLPRLGRYRRRLQRAVAEVVAGDIGKFTGVGGASFHDVWMELHEDLVVLQGIDRGAEGSF